MVSSLFEIVIGFTGLIGILLRFIGPLTIAPTITLVGVALFQSAADEAGRLTVKCHFCLLDFWFQSLVNLIDLLISHLSRYTLGNFDDVSILCPCDNPYILNGMMDLILYQVKLYSFYLPYSLKKTCSSHKCNKGRVTIVLLDINVVRDRSQVKCGVKM